MLVFATFACTVHIHRWSKKLACRAASMHEDSILNEKRMVNSAHGIYAIAKGT